MKRTLTLTAIILLSLTVQAQYIEKVPQSLERRAGNLFTEEGVKLDMHSAASILDQDMFQLYSSGNKLYRSGVIISSIGGGIEALGIIVLALGIHHSLSYSDSWVPYFLSVVSASPFMTIGGALLITSIPIFCVANARLKKVADGYSSKKSVFAPQLSLGAQPGGIGLGITF